jgi:hypothetical protein
MVSKRFVSRDDLSVLRELTLRVKAQEGSELTLLTFDHRRECIRSTALGGFELG